MLSVLRDIRCDVYESEQCLVSRRPFPGRKIFLLAADWQNRRTRKRGAICAQISIHAALLLVKLFFAVPLIPIWDLESERRDTRLAAMANVTHILKLD